MMIGTISYPITIEIATVSESHYRIVGTTPVHNSVVIGRQSINTTFLGGNIMAAHSTHKNTPAAKRATVANRRARATKRGAVAFNKSGRTRKAI